MKNRKTRLNIIAVLISAALAVIDQIMKALAVAYIKPEGSIPIIKFGSTEWVNFTYCENTGMSFSLLEGQRVLLIALPILLIAAAEWYIFSGRAKTTRNVLALSALAGGGLGNLFDRVFIGYVVDFIDFRIINFAIFNFADICAVCGGFAFAIFMCIDEYREDKAKKTEKASADDKKPDTDSEAVIKTDGNDQV